MAKDAIAVLTSDGDAPGMNAAVRADGRVGRGDKAIHDQAEVLSDY